MFLHYNPLHIVNMIVHVKLPFILDSRNLAFMFGKLDTG